MKKSILALSMFAALVSSTAYAGNYSAYPSAAGALTGIESMPADTNLPNGANPQTEIISVQSLRASAYAQSTPSTAFSITPGLGVQVVQITPAGTLATGTITTPAAPVDGQTLRIFSTQIVTAFTLTANTGQTINGTAVTALAANVAVTYMYSAATAAWFRI
jgi:hypothetical protein